MPCYHGNMIRTFKNKGTEEIFNGENTKNARKIYPQNLWEIARRKLDQLDSVIAVEELKIPPNNKLKMLSGSRAGEYSIRINKQYRICFTWQKSGPESVEIVDYH